MPNSLAERACLLLLEDSDIDAELIGVHLARSSVALEIRRAVGRAEFERLLVPGEIDIVLADYSLPDTDGLTALALARERLEDVPFVFVSGVVGEDIATESLRLGATDYVLKRNLARLPRAVERALAETRERDRRRRVEAELRTSEANTRLAVEAAQLGMWRFAPADSSLALDTRSRAMLGLGMAAQVGLAEFLERIHPGARVAAERALRDVALGPAGGGLHHETRVDLPSGDVRSLVLRGHGVFDPRGVCTQVVGVLQDVTEQRRYAEALRLANEALEERVAERTRERDRLWNLSVDLMHVGRPDGSFAAVNPAWQRLLGLPAQQLLSGVFSDFVHPDEVAQTQARLSSLGVDGAMQRFDNRLRDHRGQYRWISWTAQFDSGYVIAIGRDVSDERIAAAELAAANVALRSQIEERVRVEDTLRQMQRLEAVGQLTSGVAHDFNNLLTVVMSNIALIRRLLQQQAPAPDERMLERLDSMRKAAERGARLTTQLLAFSRRQRLEPQAIDLNDTVLGLRDLLQTTMGGSVRIETGLAASLWPALADPTQFELIILNLAINARDAMEVGGTLTLRTCNVSLTARPRRIEEPEPGDYVALSVSDTGSGMDADVLSKAFEPFFTTKEVGKGSGLGLAQVYGFAKQSGGGVRIDTAVGEGTTVHVFMPRAAGAQPPVAVPAELREPSADADAGEAAASRTLLVVDDDAEVRQVTASMLAEHGFRIVEAGSGPAALLVAEQRPEIDFVVADFAMPGMNGVEMAAALERVAPGLRVLFVTGYADLDALRHVPEEEVLQKPFHDNALVERLTRLLQRAPVRVVAPSSDDAAPRRAVGS